jgi:L-threonylcarbamoyladenylate synthase
MTDAIAHAVRTLRAGGIVGFPTETVFGLAADPTNPAAVAALFRLKGRPSSKPITLLIGPATDPNDWVYWTSHAQTLTDQLWPGPLTVVCKLRAPISPVITAGGTSLGLRMPAHPTALALLEAFGGPLAVPSANLSGQPALTSATDVRAVFGDRLPIVLDGPPCQVGQASTVISLVGTPTVLRSGAISTPTIVKLIGSTVQ